MNKRFFIILSLVTLLFGGWSFLAHEMGKEQRQSLKDLSELPVYCYISEMDKLDSILEGIQRMEGELEYKHETGFQAALELVESYGLPHSDSSIASYNLPDVITIRFPASHKAIESKTKLLSHLRIYLPEEDIDSQSGAYSKTLLRLKNQQREFIWFTAFVSILMLLVFVFGRQVLELKTYIKKQERRITALDLIRYRRKSSNRSLTMFVVPVGLSAAVYYLGAYLAFWENLAIWWSFVVMAFVCVVGTIISHLIVRSYVMDMQLSMADVKREPEPIAEESDA